MRGPTEETIRVIPTAAQFGFMRTPANEDALCIYFETATLGSFAFLVSPDTGPLMIAELKRVLDNFEDYRQQYTNTYGDC